MHTYNNAWKENVFCRRNYILNKNITCFWKYIAWGSFTINQLAHTNQPTKKTSKQTKKQETNQNNSHGQMPKGIKNNTQWQ